MGLGSAGSAVAECSVHSSCLGAVQPRAAGTGAACTLQAHGGAGAMASRLTRCLPPARRTLLPPPQTSPPRRRGHSSRPLLQPPAARHWQRWWQSQRLGPRRRAARRAARRGRPCSCCCAWERGARGPRRRSRWGGGRAGAACLCSVSPLHALSTNAFAQVLGLLLQERIHGMHEEGNYEKNQVNRVADRPLCLRPLP